MNQVIAESIGVFDTHRVLALERSPMAFLTWLRTSFNKGVLGIYFVGIVIERLLIRGYKAFKIAQHHFPWSL